MIFKICHARFLIGFFFVFSTCRSPQSFAWCCTPSHSLCCSTFEQPSPTSQLLSENEFFFTSNVSSEPGLSSKNWSWTTALYRALDSSSWIWPIALHRLGLGESCGHFKELPVLDSNWSFPMFFSGCHGNFLFYFMIITQFLSLTIYK